MADYLVKMIPTDYTYSVTNEQADRILRLIKAKIHADDIQVSIYETPAFVDCGSNLETICCPYCGTQLDFGWWGEVMDTASEDSFKDLSIITPCCNQESTLNDLQYALPCGFACMEFDILNPSADFGEEVLSAVKDLLGCPVRIVHAHI